MTARRTALLVCAVSGTALVVLGAVLVPWAWLPDGQPLVHVRADEVLSARELHTVSTYSDRQRTLSLAAYAVSLLLTLVLGLTPLGGRLLGRLRGWWWVRVVVGTFLLLLLGALVTLPFGLALHRNAVAAGISTQTVPPWLRDQGLGLLVSTVYAGVAAMVVIGLARRLPRAWPAVAAVLAGGLVFLGSFVYPLAVEPLFNSFRPLPDGPLRASVERLARTEGVRIDDVLVADASRRTTALNAYVTGFGSTRRVVLYDTAVRDLPRAQLDAIVAHELGHAGHDDVLVGTLLGACGAAFGVGLLGLLVGSDRLRGRAGAGPPGDPRTVALLLALAALASFVAAPVENAASRAVEARADRTGLLATRDPDAFVAMQKRLDLASRAEPDPPALTQLWFGTHPSTVQRIGMAEAMRATLTR